MAILILCLVAFFCAVVIGSALYVAYLNRHDSEPTVVVSCIIALVFVVGMAATVSEAIKRADTATGYVAPEKK